MPGAVGNEALWQIYVPPPSPDHICLVTKSPLAHPPQPSPSTHPTPDPISLKCHYMFVCSRDNQDGAVLDINANESWTAALCVVSPRPFTFLPRSFAFQSTSLTCPDKTPFHRICAFAALNLHTLHLFSVWHARISPFSFPTVSSMPYNVYTVRV